MAEAQAEPLKLQLSIPIQNPAPRDESLEHSEMRLSTTKMSIPCSIPTTSTERSLTERGKRMKAGSVGGNKSKKLRSGSASQVLEDAKMLLAESEPNVAPQCYWECRWKQREVQNLVTRLSADAGKVSAIMDNPEAPQVVSALLELSDTAKERFELCTLLRDRPCELVLDEKGELFHHLGK